MRHIATICMLFAALLFTQDALAQFTTDWTRDAANSNQPAWWGSPADRGVAYGVTDDGNGNMNERVFVAKANAFSDAVEIRILDADDGSDVGTLPMGDAPDGPGTYRIADVEVTDDGIIYACNVSSNSFNPFTCYRWADEQATPTAIEVYANTEGVRIGDNFGLIGSASDNSLTIMAVGHNTPQAYRFVTVDNGNTFTATSIALVESDGTTPVADAQVGQYPQAAPMGTGVSGFYVNGGGYYPMEFNAAGVRQGVASGGGHWASHNVVFFEKDGQDFILTFERGSPTVNVGTIQNVTGGAGSASLYGNTPTVGANSTVNLGDVDVRVNGDGTVTAFVLGYNNGVSAYTTNETPLPVELASFDGRSDGGDVLLAWKTASETNNAGFAVEHFRDGAFREVSFVDGAGTTAQAQQYELRVRDVASGVHRFRLKQVDFDGASAYSDEVEVAVELAGGFAIGAPYPNPFTSQARFDVAVDRSQHVRAVLYDALGREAAVLHDGVIDGTQAVQLSADGLAGGVYVVRVTGETFTGTRTVTLAR